MPNPEVRSTSPVVMPDGTIEWWELTDQWRKIRTDPPLTSIVMEDELATAIANHSHPAHGNINFTGSVSAEGDEGLTGQKTIAGYTFTFKEGLLVGFQAP